MFLTYLNILLLLDILAIIQLLFHHCDPSIKRAKIFISNFDLFILKLHLDFDCFVVSQTQWLYTFTLSAKNQVNRSSSFRMTGIQNVNFVLILATAIDIKSPPFSDGICPDVPSFYGLNIVGNC